MKGLTWILGALAVVSMANVQEKVSHEQCVFCSSEAKIKAVFKGEQHRQQVLRLDEGVMLVTIGRNETDAKAIQEIYKGMANSFASKQAKAADCCAGKLKAMQTATLEVVASKRGAMLIATSNDGEVISQLHSLCVGEDSHAQPVSSPPAGTPESPMGKTPELVFLGKGDGKKTCPVQGTAVNPNISVEYKGHTLYFCCAGCKSTFEKNPEKFVSTK